MCTRTNLEEEIKNTYHSQRPEDILVQCTPTLHTDLSPPKTQLEYSPHCPNQTPDEEILMSWSNGESHNESSRLHEKLPRRCNTG
jgi:hypothetical protein